ncbi:MAG: DUF3810 domain-containing protein [Oscillospiraceae bacterium]|jgi:hypothetical protein|nr:DUF3810 domain-containing protein [Oscillospiraceae bacterium]
MKKSLLFLSVTVFLNMALTVISRLFTDFSEWYAMNVYPVFVAVIARITGIFPFSLAEILLMLLIPAALAGVVFAVIKLVKSKGKRKRVLIKTAVYFSCAVSTALLVFMLNCGINYYRRPFLNKEGFGASEYSQAELWTVYLMVLDEFCEIASLIDTDADGAFILTSNLDKAAPDALRAAAEKYPRLKSYYPRPKPVLNSGLMSDARIIGIFSPFTIEANYNKIAPLSQKPSAVCHELAHLAGFMREEEASFISFVACRESGVPDLMYSGYLDLYGYISRELEWMDENLYGSLPDYTKHALDRYIGRLDFEEPFSFEVFGGFGAYDLLPEQAREELIRRYDFWQSRVRKITYEIDDNGKLVEVITSNPVSEIIGDISGNINDTYLKAQGQSGGVGSYGRMVDLVVAEYLSSY